MGPNSAYSFSYYFGIFVILCIIILTLLIVSPTQNCFFDLKEKYPSLYLDLHENNQIYNQLIIEIVSAVGISRLDLNIDYSPDNFNKFSWLDAKNIISSANLSPSKSPTCHNYIKGEIQILPLYYANKYYSNIMYFPQLMNILYRHNNILNVFFWKMGPGSAFLQHGAQTATGAPNINETNIIGQNVLRYTLAINPLTIMEEECSIWVSGKIKKLIFDKYILWDANKEFSLHNDTNTDGEILFLNIDFAIV